MAAPAKGPSNPLLNPTQILSGQNLQNAAHQIADAQTAGPLAELAKQIAQQNQQGAAAQGKTSGYFNQLGNFAQQGYNQEGQVANDLNAQLQGIASDTANRLQANSNDQINSYLSHVPAGQGGNLGQFGAAQVIQNGQQNSANAMRDAQTFRSGGALQGANYRDLAASNLGTFAQRGQETLGNIARATRLAEAPLNQKVAGLDASKGALYSTALGKLRSDERNYATALQSLGIKQASLANTVNQDNTRNKLTARGQDIALNGQQLAQMRSDRQFQLDQQKFGAKQAQNNYMRANGLGPYKPPSSSSGSGGGSSSKPPSAASQRVVLQKISTVRSRIQSLVSQFESWGASPANAASQAWHALNTGTYWGKTSSGWAWQHVPAVGDAGLLNAAYNTRQGAGGLTPGDIRYLQKIGLANPSQYLPTVPNYNSSQNFQGRT